MCVHVVYAVCSTGPHGLSRVIRIYFAIFVCACVYIVKQVEKKITVYRKRIMRVKGFTQHVCLSLLV